MTEVSASLHERARERESPLPKVRKERVPSLALAWAVTIAEGVVFGVLLWLFLDYWLMLPVRYRWKGIAGLTVLAAIGLTRIVLFHRRYRRAKRKHENKTS